MEFRYQGTVIYTADREEKDGLHPALLGLKIREMRNSKIINITEREEGSLIYRAILPAILSRDNDLPIAV